MIVSLNSQALAAELRLLNKVAPANPAIQVLGSILLRAEGERLNLWATDLEVGLSSSCAAEVQVGGTSLLPSARLLQMVEQFPDAPVTVATEKNQAVVRCGSYTSRLQTADVVDFPATPQVNGRGNVLDAAGLRRLIDKTRYAVSSKGSKYILQGALLTLAGKVAAMAATDSKRLALATMAREVGEESTDARFVVPAKALDMLAAGSESGDVEVTAGKQHLFFRADERLVVSRTIDGEFPKYERIIPRSNDKQITVDRGALTAALRRVALTAGETEAVNFNVLGDRIELSSAAADIGSASEHVAATYDGEPIAVTMNGSYVLDFLNASTGAYAVLALKDAKTAALFMDGNDHVGVVMLMKA